MLVTFVVFALLVSVSAAPRQKRFEPYSSFGFFPFSYVLSSPDLFKTSPPFGGGAFAGSRAFAGSGFPFGWPLYAIPMPDFSSMNPWYKGANVCETKKMIEEPEEMKEWMSDGFEGNVDYSHESEMCRGNGDKYVCRKRLQTPNGVKVELTKYECCYGFVRSADGRPGCVESSKEDSGVTSSDTKVKELYSYSLLKGNQKGAQSAAESVPIQ